MIGVNLDRQPGKVIYGILDKRLIDDWRVNGRRPVHTIEELTTQYTVNRPDGVLDCDVDYGTWLDNIYDELDKEIAGGRAAKCDTVEEIAEYIGCDPETLKKTMADYNHYCDIKYDAQFLKDPDYLVPLNHPPYYVLRGPSGIDTCLGGLMINHRQEVLDKEQYAIPGLYAAGVMTSGWTQQGGYAYFGSELSYTLFSGRNAGTNAAEYISKAGA
jgi:fumarate reductase flavoprotein subunit